MSPDTPLLRLFPMISFLRMASLCLTVLAAAPSGAAELKPWAGRRFEVLAVNLDEPEARVRKFLSQMKVDFTVLLDPEMKVAKAWNARILPASFVIGPDGRIRYSLVGELDWSHDQVVSRISELLPVTK